MTTCDTIQRRLAEDGTAVAETDAEVRRHLEDCAACRHALEALRRIESGLDALPDHDAPDSLVAETLEAVRRVGTPTARAWPRYARRAVAGGLAASVVALAGLGLTFSLLGPTLERTMVEMEGPELAAKDQVASGPVLQSAPVAPLTADDAGRATAVRNELALKQLETRGDVQNRVLPQTFYDIPSEAEPDRAYGTSRDAEWAIIAQLEAQVPPAGRQARRGDNERDRDEARLRGGDDVAAAPKAEGETAPADQRADKAPESEAAGQAFGDALHGLTEEGQTETYRSLEPLERVESPSAEPAPAMEEALSNREQEDLAAGAPGRGSMLGDRIGSASVDARHRARAFLSRYRARDGLAFQDAHGYWANTYIPGDPEMRLLEARLAAWNRSALGPDGRLEQAVRPVRQPFDAPQDAAMAVYLDADAAAIAGPTRLRVQVGLKAAERQGGHRPAMNVGLVVDLRGPLEARKAARIRALISALERARQPEDRFSLTVAGPGGGVLVPPEQFRHGPLQVAMDGMFQAPREASSSPLDLPRAMAQATSVVRQGDDPQAMLGSSVVVLVTDSALAEELARLEPVAHRNAVAGMALSIVALGGQGDLAGIDRLVAAGHGNRRILESAQAAEGLIDRELHAASRAVARALRLRIRLAAGVKLIDVLGSQPLGEPQAARVREAEQAVDQRLARNLGIQADRGEDEEGIQIVIPNFYAGDAHVILLDVVAERPGPIADVTVRYKDVIHLRNGVARASLSIGDGQDRPGPLHRNVLKNLVAYEFARETRQVGRELASGNVHTAAARLAALRDLIAGLRLEVTGWSNDPDLAADEALLGRYLAILRSPVVGDAGQRRYLADSLHYAAFRKLQASAP